MKLYFGPGACSLAPHILLHEMGLAHTTEKVDMRAKTFSGGDYRKVNPKGQVPTLELDGKGILTEAAVILQYIADQKSDSGFLPKAGTLERYRAQEWLNFIATEIHKGFGPFWKPDTPDEYKESLKKTLAGKFDYLSAHLGKQAFLLGEKFSAADAYLFTILNWAPMLKIDLTPWPALMGYMEKIKSREGVRAALKAEGLLR